jgi:hypothetical protein
MLLNCNLKVHLTHHRGAGRSRQRKASASIMMQRIGKSRASTNGPNHRQIVRNFSTSEIPARGRPALCRRRTGAITASLGGNGSMPDQPPSSVENPRNLQDELDRANIIIQQLQSEVERLRLVSLEARAPPSQTLPHAATQSEGAPQKGKQPLDKLKVLSLGLMFFCSCSSCEPSGRTHTSCLSPTLP